MKKKLAPVLVIHGGAGSAIPRGPEAAELRRSLRQITDEAYEILLRGGSALDAVVRAAALLEDHPLYNAGRGSKIQSDGKIRMSASLMDGAKLRFSGVINVEGLRNPIELARLLAAEKSRVLSGKGAADFARGAGLSFSSAYTPARLAEFKKARQGKTGTIGAVALDRNGRLAAATSTGGRGMEHPCRVSDSPTVAGNYANGLVAVSTTGFGEQIVDFALAAKVATRVEDGMSLQESFRKSFLEARRRKLQFGSIAVAHDGSFVADTTTKFLTWAARRDKFFLLSALNFGSCWRKILGFF